MSDMATLPMLSHLRKPCLFHLIRVHHQLRTTDSGVKKEIPTVLDSQQLVHQQIWANALLSLLLIKLGEEGRTV